MTWTRSGPIGTMNMLGYMVSVFRPQSLRMTTSYWARSSTVVGNELITALLWM